MNNAVLVVEDNEDDVHLIERAFRKYPIAGGGTIHCERNGKHALEYLRARLRDGSLPLLIVSDLKMPVLDGFGLLEAIREDKELRRMPFVVFTSSDLLRDRARATELGADLYLVKPSRFEEMAEIARALDSVIRDLGSEGGRSRMPVIVQSVDSGKFFCGVDRWTSVLNQALDFEVVQRALLFCSQRQLSRVRILFGASGGLKK